MSVVKSNGLLMQSRCLKQKNFIDLFCHFWTQSAWSTLQNSNSVLTGMARWFITDNTDDEGHISFSSDVILGFWICRFSSAAVHHPPLRLTVWVAVTGHPCVSPLLWATCCASSGAYRAAWWNMLRNWSGWKVIITKRKGLVISPQEFCFGSLAIINSQP